MTITIVGDVMLDTDVEGDSSRLTPDAPAPVLEERAVHRRPGGAGLAAMLAARDGRAVALVTALADDAAGDQIRELLSAAGVQLVDLGASGTTCEKIRLRARGHTLARWDRGDPATRDVGAWSPEADEAVASGRAVLVSCYGRGLTARDDVRAALRHHLDDRPLVWDPHPRGAVPVAGAAVVTPNAAEAATFVPGVEGDGLPAVTARARELVRSWRVSAAAVTMGGRGALLATAQGLPHVAPAPALYAGDVCGAGDRFATSLTGHLADGAVPSTAVTLAVGDASRFVAAGGAGSLRIQGAEPGVRLDPVTLARQVRAQGGTVVATGGCFDLLHIGHVSLLQAARSLGDCLIVCLNSDASVRRLKGPGRPVVPEADRAAVLEALGCVDGVLLFDEDTPAEALRRLRAHVFAKGGDYGGGDIPETEVLASWGGQTVTLPYVHGRSTTHILEEVLQRG